MVYEKTHIEGECDRCLKNVGLENLYKLPFLYCDKSDEMHADVSYLAGYSIDAGYRQYYCCKKCYDQQIRIINKQKK